MSGLRQAMLGVFMALLFSALVLGSLSLSLVEGGYALVQAPTPLNTAIVFNGQVMITLAGTQASPAATLPGGLVLFTPTAAQCAAIPANWVVITIHPDDTLRSLALAYQTDAETLARNNCLMAGLPLRPDTLLYVPSVPTPAAPTQPPVPPSPTTCLPRYGWVTYIVRPGDTLYSLAITVGMTPESLRAANCLASPYVWTGQAILLPFYPLVYPTYPPYPTATYAPPSTPIWLPSPTRYIPPTWTPEITLPSATPILPTLPPTATPEPPTVTPELPTATPEPTLPPLPPTATPEPPTDTPPVPTLPPPPTDTPVPLDTLPPTEPPAPPTATSELIINPPPVPTETAPVLPPPPLETLPPGQPLLFHLHPLSIGQPHPVVGGRW